MSQPRILIFDEATRALDYESERKIQDNVREICKGRTAILIAHRLSTVRCDDRINYLDKGTSAEDGTAELSLKQHGLLADGVELKVRNN